MSKIKSENQNSKILNTKDKFKLSLVFNSDCLGRFGLFGSRKSFTLIEALTSVAVFMIIATILINIYVATVRAERIAYTILRDSDITQSVIETMSRAIRMGSDFELDNNTSLTFKTEEEGKKFFTMFRYQYDDINQKGWIERIKYTNQAELLPPSDSVISPGDVVRITPENMNIDDFRFEVFGEAGEQKNVLIKFNTVSTVYKVDYKTFVQTSITPRLFIAN
jgi:Tfp pilus assembly major pilin PilA